MIGKTSSLTIAFSALLLAWSLDPDATCQAQVAQPYRTGPELFYNYYVPPGSYGGVPAALYLSPRPAPPVVGYTYITYQPLLPHEFLYPHHRRYWRYNPAAGSWTRTSVTWQHNWLDLSFLSCARDAACPAANRALEPLPCAVR
jgi:hypothetical protein